MSEPLARWEHVSAVRGSSVSGDELPTVDLLLDAASALVRRRVPTIDDRLASGDLDASLVAVVVANVVVRAMRNPEGVKQHTAGSVSFTYDDVSSTRLTLRPEEVAQLAAPRAASAVLGTARLKAGLGWC